LRQMQQDGRWDRATKLISLDIEEFIHKIEGFSANYQRYDLIKNAYPCMFFTISHEIGEKNDEVLDEYKDHHKDPETMSSYI